jgi:surface protein
MGKFKLYEEFDNREKVVVENLPQLSDIVREAAIDADLNYLDISKIKTLWNLFSNTKFNGDISKWDTSNVYDMSFTFQNSKFNGDISKWDVSKVTDMKRMFKDSEFQGDISEWKLPPEKIIELVKEMKREPEWFAEFMHKKRGLLSGKKFGF